MTSLSSFASIASLANASSLSAHFPGPSPASSPESGSASSAGSAASASAPSTVDGRSTAFQPVEGGTEHRNGETLLVAAYAGLWALLMIWVLVQWTKQTALGRRLDDLERSIRDATAKAESSAKAPPGNS